MTDVVKTTIYVASPDRAALVRAWGVIRAAFGDHDAPSTLLGVRFWAIPISSSREKRSPWLPVSCHTN